jgi:predicted Zn-dependent protease
MDYSNPEIPEGINTSKHHPLKDFFVLTAGVLGSIALCAFILSLLAEHLASHVPFSIEQDLLANIDIIDFENDTSEVQTYLDELTAKLLLHLALPEDMTVSVHYIDNSTVNAFATLGGNISIHRGLIDLLPNENALAMVIAHEIAHIKHRDPIVALGRGVVVGLFLSTIAGFGTDHFTSSVITDTGTLTILSFNREQEQRADETALNALAKHYGTVNGANALFNVFIDTESQLNTFTPEFLSTHPLSNNRIEEIKKLAKQNKWATEGSTIALPSFITKMN